MGNIKNPITTEKALTGENTNEIKLLKEQEVLGKQFKVYGTVETPLFVANDVAEWIGHSNVTEILKGIDEEEKLTTIILREDQNKPVNMLTEDGLYEVLMQSRKPIAKQFKKEVKTILKTLRKTGGYINNSDKFVDMYFNDMPEEQKNVMRGLLSSIEEKKKKIETLSAENDLLSQKVLKWADRKLILALINLYAHSIEDDFRKAWTDFKKELLYKYGINLNSRKTNELNRSGKKIKPKTLDMLTDEELPQALSTAVAMCKDKNIDISDIIEKRAS